MSRPHLIPLPQGEEADFAAGEGSNQLFAALDVYHDIDSRTAAMNMAIDEALLEIANVPTIRFYQWDHPALSFGYFGKFDDVANYQRDIVRRWTGGGIVFHGDDLTYSVVIPSSDAAFEHSSVSIYEKTHDAIRNALVASGMRADLATVVAVSDCRTKDSTIRDRRYSECFANPVRADVLLNGRKIAGAAQRRTRRGLLQQGSIQHINFGNGFGDRVAEQLCRGCRSIEVNDGLVARAQEIAKERYDRPAWLHRR
jgi:lipoate-protein ligase A